MVTLLYHETINDSYEVQEIDALVSYMKDYRLLDDDDNGEWRTGERTSNASDQPDTVTDAGLYSDGHTVQSIGILLATYALRLRTEDVPDSELNSRLKQDLDALFSLRDDVARIVGHLTGQVTNQGVDVDKVVKWRLIANRVSSVCYRMIVGWSFRDDGFRASVYNALCSAVIALQREKITADTIINAMSIINNAIDRHSVSMMTKIDTMMTTVANAPSCIDQSLLSCMGVMALLNDDVLTDVLDHDAKAILALDNLEFSEIMFDTGKIRNWIGGNNGISDEDWTDAVINCAGTMHALFRMDELTIPELRTSPEMICLVQKLVSDIDYDSARRLARSCFFRHSASTYDLGLPPYASHGKEWGCAGSAARLVLQSLSSLDTVDTVDSIRVRLITTGYDDSDSYMHLSDEDISKLNVLGDVRFWTLTRCISTILAWHDQPAKSEDKVIRFILEITDKVIASILNDDGSLLYEFKWVCDMMSYKHEFNDNETNEDSLKRMMYSIRHADMSMPYAIWWSNARLSGRTSNRTS